MMFSRVGFWPRNFSTTTGCVGGDDLSDVANFPHINVRLCWRADREVSGVVEVLSVVSGQICDRMRMGATRQWGRHVGVRCAQQMTRLKPETIEKFSKR